MGKEKKHTLVLETLFAVKVLHLNTFDYKGGAAQATYHLHRALLNNKIESQLLVRWKALSDDTVTAYRPSRIPWIWWQRKQRRNKLSLINEEVRLERRLWFDGFSDDRTEHLTLLKRNMPPCDIINLHWVSGFVDLPSFLKFFAGHFPLTWRISDMLPLTGGCHFDNKCRRFLTVCHSCPQLGCKSKEDRAFESFQRKLRAFSAIPDTSLHLIALNSWMAELVRKSPLFCRFSVEIIPNGVDTNTFCPKNKTALRKKWNVPEKKLVVLFVSDSVNNKRKGIQILLDALSQIKEVPKPFLVILGKEETRIPEEFSSLIPGHVKNKNMLSEIYALADVYVIPSVQDNMPNTLLEALASGVPSIGFSVGGIPEMIEDGKNGIIVKDIRTSELAKALLVLLKDAKLRAEMASYAAEDAKKRFNRNLQAKRYISHYNSLIEIHMRSKSATHVL